MKYQGQANTIQTFLQLKLELQEIKLVQAKETVILILNNQELYQVQDSLRLNMIGPNLREILGSDQVIEELLQDPEKDPDQEITTQLKDQLYQRLLHIL